MCSSGQAFGPSSFVNRIQIIGFEKGFVSGIIFYIDAEISVTIQTEALASTTMTPTATAINTNNLERMLP